MSSVLMIDNHDSFTFNIVEALERLGAKVRTVRNEIDPRDALDQALESRSLILLSPGPGRPEDAGCCLELIRLAEGKAPLLGVCLGHQAIVLEAGGEVVRAPEPVHGKVSLLEHDGEGPFAGLPNPLRIGRYHSLCTPNPPARFRVHARIGDMVMAISDREARQVGLQFHPESVLTPVGQKILANVLDQFAPA
ncbi:MAG: aminodeoxychorismate/anthranilate synthase component II [Pseudomonadota bacterium]|nr:aminodeoxychorismate/anthranilate synthase component II [Pseudomonadota bacterium]